MSYLLVFAFFCALAWGYWGPSRTTRARWLPFALSAAGFVAWLVVLAAIAAVLGGVERFAA